MRAKRLAERKRIHYKRKLLSLVDVDIEYPEDTADYDECVGGLYEKKGKESGTK